MDLKFWRMVGLEADGLEARQLGGGNVKGSESAASKG